MKAKCFGSVIILLVVALLLSACGSKDPLLGTWEEPVSGVSMQIEKDGTLIMGLKGISFNMTYKLEDPNIMIFVASTDGSIPEQRMSYRVEEDKLILTVDGVDTTFNRVK